ncbi:homocysteine S-methyltransferase family protein [Janibacter anophelis]|uniref:homocysteine S-methyltransferase family protein n=1 Tax=Janibacter anophelis TaxID=319054 RepID=UPI003F819826
MTTTAQQETHRPTRVTDGGMETDLIFHRGIDLPHFAAFPLVDDATGRGLLTESYDGYARIAELAGADLVLESPTWRASSDWGNRLGYDEPALAAANRNAIDLLLGLAAVYRDRVGSVRVTGMLGPRGDGYSPTTTMSADAAAGYHRPQIAARLTSLDVVGGCCGTDTRHVAALWGVTPH